MDRIVSREKEARQNRFDRISRMIDDPTAESEKPFVIGNPLHEKNSSSFLVATLHEIQAK